MKAFLITTYSTIEIKDLFIHLCLRDLSVLTNINDMDLILRRERNNALYLYLSPQYQPESLKMKLDPKIDSKLKRGTHTKVKILLVN